MNEEDNKTSRKENAQNQNSELEKSTIENPIEGALGFENSFDRGLSFDSSSEFAG